MGVPAFYRWLSEKYPKIVQDVLEERVQLIHSGGPWNNEIDSDNLSFLTRVPFDATRPNPSGLECDALYVDMNGIIHPCAHPEHGPQPATEEDMMVNVCRYIDRLMRALRPRQLLYLAIDGVAPRAKMNQQRARRFRAAQEARELRALERSIVVAEDAEADNNSEAEVFTKPPKDHDDNDDNDNNNNNEPGSGWDSNVITPGTPFMVRLATFVRFYIRKRLSHDKAWAPLKVIFSDASIPGEGEHKIMAHLRLQRAQPGYNPNLVHILHGLDADLIMLALATHEAHFYISREQVLFGRKSIEAMEQRQEESGYRLQQRSFDQAAGTLAMQLPENVLATKPLERISIPILREYLAAEFQDCLSPERLPFRPSLERLIDDIVFLCFFVGNDFLPHLPSLDIRDGALDFLFNVYKRVLPSLGDYITKSGGHVHLPSVAIIFQQVGAIEDYVFAMKHDNEQRLQAQKEERKKQQQQHKHGAPPPPLPSAAEVAAKQVLPVKGRAAKILEKHGQGPRALDRGFAAKERMRQQAKAATTNLTATTTTTTTTVPIKSATVAANVQAAEAVKQALQAAASTDANEGASTEQQGGMVEEQEKSPQSTKTKDNDKKSAADATASSPGEKRKAKDMDINDEQATANDYEKEGDGDETDDKKSPKRARVDKGGETKVGIVGDAEDEFETGENDNEEDEDEDVDYDDENDTDVVLEQTVEFKVKLLVAKKEMDPAAVAAAAAALKEKVKAAQQKQLDEYANNVQDNVRLHEPGWKDRYYSDKCKADDVEANGGREHLFRSYVVGLCWVMKYYYDGCPSWKWYFPFHYAPFASDLQNIERFQKDVRALEMSKPFNPVEQLMAVLPSDSSHAIPKAARWLMCDPESPIIDFYPKDVPVDPNGKAMPWLWVVLLPFIDEERLLDALMPTMAKWTKEELLCNAQGLDDGYLYVHKSNQLTKKLAPVLAKGKTAKDQKTRLTNTAYGAAGFTGAVRPPLSNELYPIDDSGSGAEITVVKLPPTASKIEEPGPDGLFTEDLDGNLAVCVAFSEPSKLPHKSVLLPGARPLPPVLTEDDKRIRRPRLGRGGSIANMGGGGSGGVGNGQSHQAGYGSMNIGSYERELAVRTGRGNQMYQAGTRSWGAMEPTPKLRRPPQQQQQQHPPPPPPPNNRIQPPPNPFLRQPGPQQQQQQQQRLNPNAPPFQSQQQPLQYWQNSNVNPGAYPQNNHVHGQQQQWPQGPPGPPTNHQQQGQWQPQRAPGYNNNNHRGGYNNNPHQHNNHMGSSHQGAGPPYPNRQAPPPPQQQQHQRPPQQQGFSFRNQLHGPPGGGPTTRHPNSNNNPDHHPRSRASADAMQNLRAQLSSTLMRNNNSSSSSSSNNNNKDTNKRGPPAGQNPNYRY
ncbi:hypothetical protein ACA910_014733 [Epithemia clementina (nom. ined.)]